jgi:hypothetical protein
VLSPLGLAEHRPLLAGRRRTPAFWELIARGGRPAVVVNWRGTSPAEPLAGLVVAHGAYELIESGSAPGAVAPGGRAAEVAAILAAGSAGERTEEEADALADLPAPTRAVLTQALDSDRFHRALAGGLGREARAVAVYLPALDLAAHASVLGAPRFGELVRRELVAADRLAGELADGPDGGPTTLIAVFDPGRRGGGEGRVLVWRAGCGASSRPQIELESVAAALLRAAGLPQSRELPEPPAFCHWPAAPETVPSFGVRAESATTAADDAAYLDQLRSLGYL